MPAKLLFILSTLCVCWLLMQAVHEAGHGLGAWLTGGRVQRIVLHPLAISRTDVLPNPSPMIEIWAGPIFGVLAPLVTWKFAVAQRWLIATWLRFFAGFCLIANGGYLGSGVIEPVGDAEELIRLGTPAWMLGLFGAVCLLAGFRLWHGLGPEFGWGPQGKLISWSAVAGVAGSLALVIAIEITFF